MVASTVSERRILWHPRKNRFVVGGGSQITLYDWSVEAPGIHHVTSQHDLQFMKCFAWSPDASYEDLFAVGHSTGRVDLLRLEAAKTARQNVLSSGPVVPLQVRNSRACNALAFCQADPNYLAVGLDKVRGDCSLIIWDICSSLPSLTLSPSRAGYEPISTPRPQQRIPRADLGPRTDHRILQQHAPTEVVSSLAFLPSSTHLLLAGISHRWLRLFDLRSHVPSITNVASKIQGIATDPFDQHRIGCFGDGTVTIWDTRRLVHPLLTFSEKDAYGDGSRYRANSTYSDIEFSSSRRGVLSTLEKDATYVRLWKIFEQADSSHPLENLKLAPDSTTTSQLSKRSWAQLPWNSVSSVIPTALRETEPHKPLLLCDTFKSQGTSKTLASFAMIPSSVGDLLTSKIMVVSKEGDLETLVVHDTPKHGVWSSQGGFTIAAGHGCQVFPPGSAGDNIEEPWNVRKTGESLPLPGTGPSFSPQAKNHPVPKNIVPSDGIPVPPGGIPILPSAEDGAPTVSDAGMALTRLIHLDISMVIRRRVLSGYGIDDAFHNHVVVRRTRDHGSEELADLWLWIHHAKQVTGSSNTHSHGYDFSYEGVLGIWDGLEALDRYNSASLPSLKRQPMSGTSQSRFQAALLSLVEGSEESARAWKAQAPTTKPLQRYIALQLLAWHVQENELNEDIRRWESEGSYTRAACWLVFSRQSAKAIELLMRSEDEVHQMMSGTLAAMTLPGASSRTLKLREHYERLILKINDPYFRALLTHLTLGDWLEVLEEEAIPFRERLAIAFQFLDDKALSSYLHRCKEAATSKGNIDCIVVVGLAQNGMDLLQNYLNRSGDLQTVAILAAHTYPWKVTDMRARQWIENYRDLLDSFKLHHHRVSFDAERGEILQRVMGSSALIPSQVLIRCNYCNKNMSIVPPAPLIFDKATACPHCKRALPRCSVCLMTLSLLPRHVDSRYPGNRIVTNLQQAEAPTDTIDEALVICQTCRHGGHASHIIDWFYGSETTAAHRSCPVAQCTCNCADEF